MKKLISLVLAGCLMLAAPTVVMSDIKVVGRSEISGQINIMIDHRITENSYGEFMEATGHLRNTRINLYIHTNGGDAYATVGIVNRILDLKDRGCKIVTIVMAKALSAGGYIFLMGDERIAYEGSTLMFHAMMQQKSKAFVDRMRKDRGVAVGVAVIERMDKYIGERFRKVVGDRMSEKTIQYFLNGTAEEDVPSQYMSALTAFNTGVATKYISANR
jgi:ATP-dependent protease ClpP protease subunit